MNETANTVRIQCPKCGAPTNHAILHHREVSGETDEVQWMEDYQIVMCKGCDTVSFRKEWSTSEDWDPETGDSIISEDLFPERSAGRRSLDHHWHFPLQVSKIYQETIKALNSNLPILSAIGLRAIIEAICNEQKIDGRDLKVRIDGLHKAGHLSKTQAEMLHNHRFLGNVAAHEITAPSGKELVAAIDIAETLLKTLYILPHTATEISKATKVKGVKASR